MIRASNGEDLGCEVNHDLVLKSDSTVEVF
ncbi:MAG: hypothetical protein K0S04_3345 [Herbinix sp.]|jgi:hypothetical protein|nr:hypothetical protein [Herbinix sp.]